MSSKRNVISSLALIAGFAILAGATAAKPGLNNEARITDGLISTAIAYEIGSKCDSLEPRIIQGINFLYELRTEAQTLGYSGAEIDDYIENEAEKDRLEVIARDRLRDMGGVEGEWETYCAVGRAEIATGSQIGQLLR